MRAPVDPVDAHGMTHSLTTAATTLLTLAAIVAMLTAGIASTLLSWYPPSEFTAADGAGSALELGLLPMLFVVLLAAAAVPAGNGSRLVIGLSIAIPILGLVGVAASGAWTVVHLDPSGY